jgi:tagaturonate reductase
LGHTVLAEEWMIKRRPAAETVAEILSDQQTHRQLREIYAEEVIPGFAAMEMHETASRYVVTTIERFRNSFLKHRMSDIADNHAAKVNRRVRTFLTWVRQRNATLPLPRLTALAAKYG